MSVRKLLPTGTWKAAGSDMASRLDVLEQRLGHSLPTDLRDLYLECTDLSLAGGAYRFLAPEEIASVSQHQLGHDDVAPRTWIAVIDLQDGDFIGLDLIPNAAGRFGWLDCCHETVGEAAVIAESLAELVESILAKPQSHYWLAPGYKPHRRLTSEPLPSYWRRIHEDWYRALGDEVGDPCTTEGCGRRRIRNSVKCRPHHYAMVHGRPSPFEGV